jgi:hypothetical protein
MASLGYKTPLPSSRLKVGSGHLTFSDRRNEQDGSQESLIWLEVRLSADWVAAHRLISHGRRHVIAEVRLLPYEDGATPGEWSGASHAVPVDGVPWEKLRELRTERAVLKAQEIIEFLESRAGGAYLERVLSRFELGQRAINDVVPAVSGAPMLSLRGPQPPLRKPRLAPRCEP